MVNGESLRVRKGKGGEGAHRVKGIQEFHAPAGGAREHKNKGRP